MTDLNHHVAAQTIHEHGAFQHVDSSFRVFRIEHSESFYGQKYQYFFDVIMCYKIVIGEKVVYYSDMSSCDEEQEEEKGSLVVIPYVAGMSEDIRRACRKSKIKVVIKYERTLRSNVD